MADALRAAARVPGFVEAADLWLVETSPSLRKKQWEALGKHEPSWADTLTDVPKLPVFLIANELFDALPIRQFEIANGALCERVVGIKDGALTLGLSPPVSDEALPDHVEEGTIIETCPAGRTIAAELGRRLKRDGGAALIIDYGHDTAAPRGDTLQAVKDHAYTDIFAEPGRADLTAHVDFRTLAKAAEAEGATSWGVRSQGALLDWLGIRVRAAMLAKASPEREAEIEAALDRLTEPDQMGTLFKALALSGDEVDPPGFSKELGA
jgi:NADH dehydrogenase [ubiquinone] 1 alpha subcomplex assembly factor 7